MDRGELVMTFKVYSGPTGTESISPLNRDHMLFKEFPTFDEALAWADHIRQTGRVPLLIEDDGGMRLDKREIAAELGHRSTRAVRDARAG
jgi:hypothetical protein